MMHESHDGWDEDMGIIRGVADTYDFGRHQPETSAERYQRRLWECHSVSMPDAAMDGQLRMMTQDYYRRVFARQDADEASTALAALLNLADYHGVR